jgi:serine/threonine protein kinase
VLSLQSPENVLFVQEDRWELKVADLGLARIAESGVLTRAGIRTFAGGTEDYTPFEVRYGKVKADARTDIYSLGVILHELLTREPLHWGNATREAVDSRPDLSKSAKDIVIRACKLMGSRNYSTIQQFLDGFASAKLI